jgi:hypothetical protein
MELITGAFVGAVGLSFFGAAEKPTMYPAVSLAGMKAAGMAAAETGVGAMEMPTVAPFCGWSSAMTCAHGGQQTRQPG